MTKASIALGFTLMLPVCSSPHARLSCQRSTAAALAAGTLQKQVDGLLPPASHTYPCTAVNDTWASFLIALKMIASVAALPEPSRAASVPQQLQSLQSVLEQAASSRDGAGFLPASFGSGLPSLTSCMEKGMDMQYVNFSSTHTVLMLMT